ncbi:hypothetical protein NPIRD3C_1864 [Nitrosopumilus piranensis]|uniref:Uncharacterized protein n=1 Tax=Nitrosopumilus piranensis TaxID=1582439 RepID=A0A0C5BXR3_9ARCH|nr:hypothetical protein NPIRD3C_1864 [Nitrosopumilus piranensis]
MVFHVFGHALSITIISFIVASENSIKLSKNDQKIKHLFKFRNFSSNIRDMIMNYGRDSKM